MCCYKSRTVGGEWMRGSGGDMECREAIWMRGWLGYGWIGVRGERVEGRGDMDETVAGV